MSIAPPSDIILDVAQAADPQRLQAATVKLNSMATAAGGVPADFQSLLAHAASRSTPAGAPAINQATASTSTVKTAMSPYRKFEAVLLQTFVQEMLPKDDDLYGDATTSDAYRSMMAEQLADQLAKSGRIGIAKMIEKAHPPHGAAHPQAAAAGSLGSAGSAQVAIAAPDLAAAPPLQMPRLGAPALRTVGRG